MAGLVPLLLFGWLAAAPAPSVVLITLDTTRADHVGRVEGGAALTPYLDALAAGGVRFRRALTASPLTLPAHCSLLTGLEPPAHGVRDNGVASLPGGIPTLAEAFSERGYRTAAFVASRVLDRRFGLSRGFEVYDDFIVAERPGEQGYPERDAAQVTGAALAWAASAKLAAGRPYFLWVHYYDPHAPYLPPGDWRGATPARRYAGEIAYVDREIGRLLGGLPGAGRRIVAAVGDHGEMLGEHGEKEHGIFLYEGALAVPLILSGPGVPRGRVVEGPAGTRGLAATLLALSGSGGDVSPFGAELPGVRAAAPATPAPVYGETDMPASAYGWSPLAAATDERLRLIVAPRPELYDLRADPAESRNLWGKPEEAESVRLLQKVIAEANRGARTAGAPADTGELAESLRSLGYLSGSSGRAGSIDPKDGIRLLDDFEKAKELTRSGRATEAVAALTALVKASPGNVPFLARLAEAQAAAGRVGDAIQTVSNALSLNPGLDFLHLQLARLLVQAGRVEDGRAAFRAALAINPRLAPAWLGLGELAARTGGVAEERRLLNEAAAANVQSAALYARLAQVELAAGETPAAATHALEALRLLPEFAQAWWIAGEAAEKQGRPQIALERFEKAVALGLEDPRALVRVGRLLLDAGRKSEAEVHLRRAVVLGAGTASAEDARRLLSQMP
jgi:arylsulfatase A-like enzyme/Flp pilus assembly protein TadD